MKLSSCLKRPFDNYLIKHVLTLRTLLGIATLNAMKVFLLTSVFLLSGCAFQRLAVTQLDNLVEIQLGSKLDLYRNQKKVLEADVSLLLESQKPYLESLILLVKKIDPTKVETFPDTWSEISTEYRRVAHAFSGILAKHLVTLDPKQRAHFFTKMKTENEEILERSKKQSVENSAKRVVFFLGEVTESQEKVLERNLPEIKRRSLARLERRELLHKKLADILSSTAFSADKERSVLAAFEAYQLDAAQEQGPVVQMIQDLCRELTPTQIKTFQEKRKDALELAALYKETDF